MGPHLVDEGPVVDGDQGGAGCRSLDGQAVQLLQEGPVRELQAVAGHHVRRACICVAEVSDGPARAVTDS